MAELADRDRELVAIGTAIGAGCQPCTQYHVGAAQEAGLSADEVRRAIEGGLTVRIEGGNAVANAVADGGRRLLGDEAPRSRRDGGRNGGPTLSGRGEVLAYLGAAGGCNAGGLLAGYLAAALGLGVSDDELRAALEVTTVAKSMAATFSDREAERVLGTAAAPQPAAASAQGCCGPGSEC